MEEAKFRPEQEIVDAETREKVKKVEQLKIGPMQKAEIILVLLGLKPAKELDLFKNNDDKETVEGVLKQVGLQSKPKEIPVPSENVTDRLAIAKDEETLNQLLTLDAKKDHTEYGRLMGYPETAIAAFDQEKKLLAKDDYPDTEGIIFDIKLSKDNWPEELEKLKEWSGAIKEYAPDLYEQLKGK